MTMMVMVTPVNRDGGSGVDVGGPDCHGHGHQHQQLYRDGGHNCGVTMTITVRPPTSTPLPPSLSQLE